MTVTQAVRNRRSVRHFLDTPVDTDILRQALETAQYAPSGGNLQPWHAEVLTGEPLAELKAAVATKLPLGPDGQSPEYPIYPKGLQEPYRSRRYGVGEALYDSLGIAREDKMGRMMQMARNFQAFDAPVCLFVHTPKNMGPPQWSDIGMWMQTLMLLLVEAGLDSCPQEAWSIYGAEIRTALGLSDDHIFFCGMAIGHRDPEAPVNRFPVPRAPLSEAISFHGFA
ncbi:MAG: nitroreductase family protein [Pseudomonadota bacterium]